MTTPKILKENAQHFLETREFDLYIANPFSARFIPKGANSLILTHSNYVDLPNLVQAMPNKNGRILAFGAGSVIDPAKYLAKITDSHLTVIPSALSVNSFATHRSSFFDGQSKKSFDTVAPHVLVLDYDLLKSAGILNALGVIELSSTATAQVDWSSAIENGFERADAQINERSNILIKETIGLLNDYENISSKLEKLFEGLLESGLLTQEYGNGCPVSGSEHIISSHIENKIVGCAHGAGLYVGILIAAALQKQHGKSTQQVEVIADYLLGSRFIREYIKQQFSKKIIQDILSTVRPRVERHTIINDFSPEAFQLTARETCDMIFK